MTKNTRTWFKRLGEGGGGVRRERLVANFVRFKNANKKNFQNATVVWTYDLHSPGVVTHSLSKLLIFAE